MTFTQQSQHIHIEAQISDVLIVKTKLYLELVYEAAVEKNCTKKEFWGKKKENSLPGRKMNL